MSLFSMVRTVLLFDGISIVSRARYLSDGACNPISVFLLVFVLIKLCMLRTGTDTSQTTDVPDDSYASTFAQDMS